MSMLLALGMVSSFLAFGLSKGTQGDAVTLSAAPCGRR